MLRIGLTGGIGAGKSTVAAGLAGLGAVLVDADRLAREVLAPGTPGLAEVTSSFGPQVVAADGSLDRPALGRLVFADPRARARLEAITHPRIAELTSRAMAAAGPAAIVVHDVPLLVENRMGARYHLVVVVHAGETERLRRLVTERGMAEADALARIRAQADDRARRAAADVWLDNSGAPGDLAARVGSLWRERIAPFEQNLGSGRPAARPAELPVRDHDPAWAAQSARLLARIGVAAGPQALRLDHVGPTAVPDLPAQDVLDLQLVVPDLATADRLQPQLEAAGHARCPGDRWDDDPAAAAGVAGDRPAKRLYAGCDPGRPVNLHVRELGSPAWTWVLLYRDWLRAHPAERAALERSHGRGEAGASPTGQGAWFTGAAGRARNWATETGWVPAEPPG